MFGKKVLWLLLLGIILAGCSSPPSTSVSFNSTNIIQTDLNSIANAYIWQTISAVIPWADVNVANDLDINSEGDVDWLALSNYPAACPAGQAVQVIGDTLTCVTISGGGRTYTSGTPATIQVKNDTNTILQNFDGNFYSRLNGLLPWADVNVADNIVTDFNLQINQRVVNKVLAGTNVTVSCTGSDSNGFCTVNSTASGGGGIGRTYTSGTPGTIQVSNDLNTISLNFDGNFYSRLNNLLPWADVNIASAGTWNAKLSPTQFMSFFDGNLASRMPWQDANVADNIVTDFNFQINQRVVNKLVAGTSITLSCTGTDSNGVCTVNSTASGTGGGRTYTSGTPATIQVNNDANTISQNFDGNFYSRLAGMMPIGDFNISSLSASKLIWDSNGVLDGRYIKIVDTNNGARIAYTAIADFNSHVSQLFTLSSYGDANVNAIIAARVPWQDANVADNIVTDFNFQINQRVVNKVLAGTNVTVSCTGTDSNGNCTVNSTASGSGGSILAADVNAGAFGANQTPTGNYIFYNDLNVGRLITNTLGSKDNNALSLQTNNTTRLTIGADGNVGINTITPNRIFHLVGDVNIIGVKPATIATSPGLSSKLGGMVSIISASGGDTSIATTGVGGIGADINLLAGGGGIGNSALTSSTGGAGGVVTIQGGRGGSPGAVGIGTARGGAGGAVNIFAGDAGTATLGNLLRASAGGTLTIRSGHGSDANNTTGQGTGGVLTISSGNGGNGNNITGNNGGAAAISTGNGGNSTGGNGGNAGNFSFNASGTGVGGNTTSGTGGVGSTLTFRAGIGGDGNTGGAAGSLTFLGIVGGAGTTGNGGTGTSINLTSGAGGISSGGGNGGAGGSINLTAGSSGTGGIRVSGSSVYVLPGDGNLTGNIILGANSSATNRGNVGIGFFLPQNKLNVVGDLNVIDVNTSSTPSFFVALDRNVGVGTGLPKNIFNVVGDANITSSFYLPSLTDGCVQIASGLVTSTGSACGAGGSGISFGQFQTAFDSNLATRVPWTDVNVANDITVNSSNQITAPSAVLGDWSISAATRTLSVAGGDGFVSAPNNATLTLGAGSGGNVRITATQLAPTTESATTLGSVLLPFSNGWLSGRLNVTDLNAAQDVNASRFCLPGGSCVTSWSAGSGQVTYAQFKSFFDGNLAAMRPIADANISSVSSSKFIWDSNTVLDGRYAKTADVNGNFVPYIGASSAVNLATQKIYAAHVGVGITSSFVDSLAITIDKSGDTYPRVGMVKNGDSIYTTFGLDTVGSKIRFNSLDGDLTDYYPFTWEFESAEKMRLTKDGNLGIGSIAPSKTLTVTGDASISNKVFFPGLSASGVGDTYVCISSANELRTGATCAASTKQIKEDIKPVLKASEVLKKLNAVSFTYKDGYYAEKDDIGFIAEEVNKVDTRLTIKDEKGVPYAINYNAITALNTKTIQELQVEIQELRKEIDLLKAKK